MAKRSRFFFAALAAVTLLTACGGGEEVIPQQKVAAPFQGATSAVDKSGVNLDGQARKRILAAPSQAMAEGFKIIFTHQLGAVVRREAQTAVNAAAVLPEYSTEVLLDWAERQYPSLFPSHELTKEETVEGNTYDYRGYVVGSSANFVGTCKRGTTCVVGGVYGIGPFTGNVLTYFGTSESFKCVVNVDYCRPRLLSVTPFDGATGITAKNTSVVFTWSEELDCRGISAEGRLIGSIIAAVSCVGNTLTVTPDENRWPYGSTNSLTVANLPNLAGYLSLPVEMRFITLPVAVPEPKVYTGNWDAHGGTGGAVTVINTATWIPQSVAFPSLPNYAGPRRLLFDAQAGVVYVGMGGGLEVLRVDLESNTALTPLPLGAVAHFPGVQGLALVETDICAAKAKMSYPDYEDRNQLECWNRFTRIRSFRSGRDHLAGSDMVVMDLVSVPERKRFYALAATALAYDLISDNTGQLKQEFTPGSRGMVTEFDAETKQPTGRSWVVGAGPRSAVYNSVQKKLYVANSGGDVSLSTIDLEVAHTNTNAVSTRRIPSFTGFQRPMGLVLLAGRLYVTDYVDRVFVLNPETLEKLGEVWVGYYPLAISQARGMLYVPNPRRIGNGGSSLSVVNATNPANLTVTQVIPIPLAPSTVLAFDPAAP